MSETLFNSPIFQEMQNQSEQLLQLINILAMRLVEFFFPSMIPWLICHPALAANEVGVL